MKFNPITQVNIAKTILGSSHHHPNSQPCCHSAFGVFNFKIPPFFQGTKIVFEKD